MVLTKKAISRIQRDLRVLTETPLVMENIFLIPDDEDIRVVRACIIGPEDTPYENGFYFYEFVFPNNYPYSPPKAKFFSTDGYTRMHPNFYTCGKVCVSILGTWTGPGWTSGQSISSVLLTLRSLMIKNPLWQEPGFHGSTSTVNSNYNTLIKYENIRIGIHNMIKNTPRGFEPFHPIMRNHFISQYDKIIKKLGKLKKYHNTSIQSPKIFKFSKTIDVDGLKSKLKTLKSELEADSEAVQGYHSIWNWISQSIPIEGITYKELEALYSKEDLHHEVEDPFNIAVWIHEKNGLITRNHEGVIFPKKS